MKKLKSRFKLGENLKVREYFGVQIHAVSFSLRDRSSSTFFLRVLENLKDAVIFRKTLIFMNLGGKNPKSYTNISYFVFGPSVLLVFNVFLKAFLYYYFLGEK
jgi:hypothetical protein